MRQSTSSSNDNNELTAFTYGIFRLSSILVKQLENDPIVQIYGINMRKSMIMPFGYIFPDGVDIKPLCN